MRKMPPKHLQMAQKLGLSYLSSGDAHKALLPLLASTVIHFTPHLTTS
jgi:hypothetical protein